MRADGDNSKGEGKSGEGDGRKGEGREQNFDILFKKNYSRKVKRKEGK